MAVYTVEQGQLAKVAATLEEYVGVELIEDYDDYLKQQGFHVVEQQEHAYQMLSRFGQVATKEGLSGIKYLFDVAVITDDSVDYIAVQDDLDAYLDVLKKLEPLVSRGLRLQAELERDFAPRN